MKMMAIAPHLDVYLPYVIHKASDIVKTGVGYCFIHSKAMREPDVGVEQSVPHLLFLIP